MGKNRTRRRPPQKKDKKEGGESDNEKVWRGNTKLAAAMAAGFDHGFDHCGKKVVTSVLERDDCEQL